MKQLFIYVFFIGIILYSSSCKDKNEPSKTLTGSETLNVKFPISGSENTYSYLKNTTNEVGKFYCAFSENTILELHANSSSDTYFTMVFHMPNSPIIEGKTYVITAGNVMSTSNYVDFGGKYYGSSWGNSKTEFLFSSFKYPGRIKGTTKAYNSEGNLHIVTEFDFISVVL